MKLNEVPRRQEKGPDARLAVAHLGPNYCPDTIVCRHPAIQANVPQKTVTAL
ncbi:hypothetical protein HFP05_09680 [Rhodanobacter denitrificans]|nr:hypothetical protein [Rhodanobacter denitrificans]